MKLTRPAAAQAETLVVDVGAAWHCVRSRSAIGQDVQMEAAVQPDATQPASGPTELAQPMAHAASSTLLNVVWTVPRVWPTLPDTMPLTAPIPSTKLISDEA